MRYRNIHCKIWNDDKFPFVSDDCQLVIFHIHTTPLSTPFGLYKASLPALAAEKRWTEERYTKAFREALGEGFLKYDEKHLVVLIPKYLDYNPPQSPNVLISWKSALDEVPDSSLKSEFIQSLKALLEGYGKGYQEAFVKAFPKVCRKSPATAPVLKKGIKEGGVGETITQIITPGRFKEWFDILKTIPEYPFNEKLDFEFLSEKEKDFPKIDITLLLKAWKIYIGDTPFKENSRHRSQLHSQFELAVKYNKHAKLVSVANTDRYYQDNALDKIAKDKAEFEKENNG